MEERNVGAVVETIQLGERANREELAPIQRKEAAQIGTEAVKIRVRSVHASKHRGSCSK